MAVIKKKELQKLTPEERNKKIVELERAILELRGEGRKEKIKPLRKTIARLRTPALGSQSHNDAPKIPQALKSVKNK